MIIKSTYRGASRADLAEHAGHVLAGEENESIEVLRCDGFGVEDFFDTAWAFRLTAGADKAVLHGILSPSDGEVWTDEGALAAAQRWADANGASSRPVLVVKHEKDHTGVEPGSPRVAHYHVDVQVVHPLTLKALNPWKPWIVNERVARELEHAHGVPFTSGRYNKAVIGWFERGTAEIAAAMRAQGLHEAARPVAKVTARERAVAQRAGRDPFDLVRFGQAALAQGLRGGDLVAALRKHGHPVARGNSRIVVLPENGGKPIGLARKMGLKEKALRELLGPELDRLPMVAEAPAPDPVPVPTQQEAAHVAMEEGIAAHDRREEGIVGCSEGLAKESGTAAAGDGQPEPAAGALVARPTGPDPRRHSDGRRNDGDDAIARPQGAVSAGVRGADDCGGHGPGRIPAGGALIAAAGRAGRPHGHGGYHQGDGRGDRPHRSAPGPDRAAAFRRRAAAGRARQVLEGRGTDDHRAVTARLRQGPAPAWAVECLPWDPQEDAARRAAWRAGLLRRAYGTGWLPPAVVADIRWVDIDRAAGVVTLTLITGAKLVDTGDRVELHGRADNIGVREVLAVAERRAWGAIEVSGPDEFRRQVAMAAALREPPITVTNYELVPADQAAVDREFAQRQLTGVAAPVVPPVDTDTQRAVPAYC